MWVYIKSGIIVAVIYYLGRELVKTKTVVTDVTAGGARCVDGATGKMIPCKQGHWDPDTDPLGLENDVNVENYIQGLLQDASDPLLGAGKTL